MLQALKHSARRYALGEALAEGWFAAKGHFYARRRTLTLTVHRRRVAELPEVRGQYLFTSEHGLYAIERGALYRLTSRGGYGIAISGDDAYCSLNFGAYSCVVRFPQAALHGQHAAIRADICYGYTGRDSGERIHQLSAGPDGSVWVAASGRNCLVRIRGASYDEYFPFADSFGKAIVFDQHHINSVSDYGAFQLFVAGKAGSGSLIGMLHEGRVTGFSAPHKGVHDVHHTPRGLAWCDTFGADALSPSGRVHTSQGPLDTASVDNARMLRGLAGSMQEWLVGYSHHAPRPQRYSGTGGILIMQDGVQTRRSAPCAQVYQIIRRSGGAFDPAPVSAVTVRSELQQCFGAPIYESSVITTMENIWKR